MHRATKRCSVLFCSVRREKNPYYLIIRFDSFIHSIRDWLFHSIHSIHLIFVKPSQQAPHSQRVSPLHHTYTASTYSTVHYTRWTVPHNSQSTLYSILHLTPRLVREVEPDLENATTTTVLLLHFLYTYSEIRFDSIRYLNPTTTTNTNTTTNTTTDDYDKN